MTPRLAGGMQGLVVVLALVMTSPAEAQDGPRLAAIFDDHAVLQRDRPISVWGTGAAGARLTVDLGGHTVETTTGADGLWSARLPARGAGGPFTLRIRDAAGAGDQAADVLVGDVWLCSGQSNMELPVSRTLNGPSVTGSANDPALRLLTIAKDFDPVARNEFRNPVAWAPAGPDTVGNFSATCYYFGQDLRRDHDVPMGLINASWGGSNIETWMSGAALERAGEGERLSILSRLTTDPLAAQAAWGDQWQAWWRGQASDTPWSPADPGPWSAVPAMAPWERWGVPELAAYNGMVWFRLDIELTAEQAREAQTLTLGNVDEADQTWVNGVAVGASGSGDRRYDLPRGLLKAGANTIVVNAYDTWEVGGLYGPAEKRALILANGEAVPLDPAGWRYRVATNVTIAPPRAPWSSTSGLTTIGNAMIAPMHDYGLRGALWYQGESNTGEGLRYRDLLAGL
ncbi:MAG TPA: sialate O-acetylesterase, partial [Brevundimonas sp.]